MRNWRAGSLTLGVVLVVFGVSMVISKVFGTFTIVEVALWWPILLIFLGCEVLAALFFSTEKPLKVKFDAGSIFLMSLMLIFTIGISTVSYAINLVPGGISTLRSASFHEKAVINKEYSLVTQSLRLNNSVGGNVTISSCSGNEARISAVVTINNMTNEILKEKKNEIISVDKESGQISTLLPEYSSYLHNIRVDFVIKVPVGIKVEVQNQNGNVNISDTNCAIVIENKKGSVNANKAEGTVAVNNEGGDINMSSIKGNLNIGNKDGNIRITDVKAKSVINSDKGNIEILTGNETKEDISINSSGGNTKLFLVENQGGILGAVAYSGNISTNIKGVIKEDGGAKRLEATFPDVGPKFDILTNTGNLEVIVGKAK